MRAALELSSCGGWILITGRVPLVLKPGPYVLLFALLCSEPGAGIQGTKTVESLPAVPQGAGVYYRLVNSEWFKLRQPTLADSKTQGMGRFLDTNGWSGLNVTLAYTGSQAPLRVEGPKPTFYVRETGAAREAIIVQLAQKKETRETKISSTEAGSGNKLGFRNGEIRRVVTVDLARNFYTVTPELSLKPGEYLLVLGEPGAIFDFGVGAARK